MANNCLVTKLRGVVDNDSLVVFGTIRVHINTDGFDMTRPFNDRSIIFRIKSNNECHIKAIGNGTFGVLNSSQSAYAYEDVSECTIQYGDTGFENGWATIVPNAGEYDIELGVKYNAVSFSFGADFTGKKSIFDLSDFDLGLLNYMPLEQNIYIKTNDVCKGIYSPVSKSLPAQVSICRLGSNTHIQGKFVDFDSITDTSRIVNASFKGLQDQDGSILKFSDATNLVSLVCAYTKIDGDVAALAAAQAAAGRTSGVIDIEASWSNVTIDGVPFTEAVQAHDSWHAYIVFDPSYTGGYNIVYTAPATT